MNFVVDTDIFIDFLRGVEASKIFFKKIFNSEIVAFVSVITEAELMSGEECNDVNKKLDIAALLGLVSKVDVNSYIASKAGELRRRYKITITDAIIAATALEINAPIYTRNTKDFSKINELEVKPPY